MSTLESITGPHPESWKLFTLGDVSEIKNGPTELRKNWSVREGIPVFSPSEINNGQLLLERASCLPPEEAEKYRSHFLCEGDVLLARAGRSLKMGLYRLDRDALVDSSCFRIRLKNKNLMSDYLIRYLAHPAVQEWIERSKHRGVISNLRISEITKLPVLMPPMGAQREMVGIFSELDEKIQIQEEIIAATQQLRDTLTRSFWRFA